MSRDILDLDATDQLTALAAREVSAVELFDLSTAREASLRESLNLVVVRDLEGGRSAARASDDRRAKGEALGLLDGLPMTLKDTLDVVGMPASAGVEALRNRPSCQDAETVARARAAGAVLWGKTNIPVMAGDWQSFNSLYGVSNNPWDPARTTGGSSGGAAGALATGITALEIGSWTSVAHCGFRPISAGSIPTSPAGRRSPNGGMSRQRRDHMRPGISTSSDPWPVRPGTCSCCSPSCPAACAAPAPAPGLGACGSASGWTNRSMPWTPKSGLSWRTYGRSLEDAGAQVELIASPGECDRAEGLLPDPAGLGARPGP